MIEIICTTGILDEMVDAGDGPSVSKVLVAAREKNVPFALVARRNEL